MGTGICQMSVVEDPTSRDEMERMQKRSRISTEIKQNANE